MEASPTGLYIRSRVETRRSVPDAEPRHRIAITLGVFGDPGASTRIWSGPDQSEPPTQQEIQTASDRAMAALASFIRERMEA